MSWKDEKSADDVIDATEWTNQANTLEAVSGSYYGHSGNKDIHFPSSNMTNWFGILYQPSGTTPDHIDVISISTQSLSSNTINTYDIHFDDVALGASPYDNIRTWWKFGNSPGLLSGGTITSGSNVGTDITFDVGKGTGLLRPTDNDYDDLYTIVWSESTGNQVSKGDLKFVGIEYNAGSPQVTIKDTFDFDFDTDFPLGIVANRSGVACVFNKPWKVNDFLTNVMERFDGQGWIIRDDHIGGLMLGDTGTRNVTLTAGKLWTRLNEHDVSAKDTSDGDTFVKFRPNGVDSWTVSSQTATQWSNLHYNNDGVLTAHTNNRYGVVWFYILPKNNDGELAMLYGDVNSTSSADAENATPPASPPGCIREGGLLVGRIVYREGVDTPIEVQSAFSTTFQAAQAADHGNLTGLSDDDHTQYYNQTRIATISSNAKSGQEAKSWLNDSGSKYHNTYSWYSNSSNKLTDAYNERGSQIDGTGLIWDGSELDVEGYATISSNASNAASFSSNSDIFDESLYMLSSNIKLNYYPSSLGKEIYTWMDNSGSKYSQAYASAQIAIYNETYSSEGDLISVLDDNYYPSSSGKILMDWMTNSGSSYSQAYASSQIALYNSSDVDHDATTNFVENEHVDHSGVNITSGDGLTGGGDITSTRTITVGAGTGITVNADDVEVTDYNGIKASAACGAWVSSNAYTSEADLTGLLDDNYAPSGDLSWSSIEGLSDVNTMTPSDNDVLTWDAANSKWSSQASTGGGSYISSMTDASISSPASGEVLTWDGNDWANKLPAMTYDIANIKISANQNINLARFSCPAGKKAYVWQAYACNSGQASVADLCIELLSGNTSVYKTSSSELQQGNPLAVSDGGNTEIRFMYSGANASGYEYGTGMIQVSVY
jgi:hypothetical protein